MAERIDKPRYAALCRGNLAYMAIERREFDLARQELAAASRWAALARQRMESSEDGIYEVQMLLIEAELIAPRMTTVPEALRLPGHLRSQAPCTRRGSSARAARRWRSWR